MSDSSSHSHPQTDSQLILDDSDGEDDARACIPCPFCYVDIALSMLCSHLQEDHCFDLKCAVCDSLSDFSFIMYALSLNAWMLLPTYLKLKLDIYT